MRQMLTTHLQETIRELRREGSPARAGKSAAAIQHRLNRLCRELARRRRTAWVAMSWPRMGRYVAR